MFRYSIMPSRWISWIKEWASEQGKSYGCALSDPKCSAEYRRTYKLPLLEKHQAVFAKEEKKKSNKQREQERRNVLRDAGVNTLRQLKNKS